MSGSGYPNLGDLPNSPQGMADAIFRLRDVTDAHNVEIAYPDVDATTEPMALLVSLSPSGSVHSHLAFDSLRGERLAWRQLRKP